MAAQPPSNILGTCPTFDGKRKEAKEFITNIEIYFNMNQTRISTDELKILLALQNINKEVQQWKENKKTDLDNPDVAERLGIIGKRSKQGS